MIVVVTGSREWTDRMLLRAELDSIHQRYGITWLIEGGAEGADTFAGSWAKEKGLPLNVLPYASAHGSAGGGIRNGWMLTVARALALSGAGQVLVLAFPTKNSIGTWNCVKQAKAAGLNIRIVTEKGLVIR